MRRTSIVFKSISETLREQLIKSCVQEIHLWNYLYGDKFTDAAEIVKSLGFVEKAKESDMIMLSFEQNLEDCLKEDSALDCKFVPSVALLDSYQEDYEEDAIMSYYYHQLIDIHNGMISYLQGNGVKSDWLLKREGFKDQFLEINMVFKVLKRISEVGIAQGYFERTSLLSNEELRVNGSKGKGSGYLQGLYQTLAGKNNEEIYLENPVLTESLPSGGSSTLKSEDSLTRRLPKMNADQLNRQSGFSSGTKNRIKESLIINRFEDDYEAGNYIHSFGNEINEFKDPDKSPRFSSKKPDYKEHISLLSFDVGVQTDKEQIVNSTSPQLEKTLSLILEENAELKRMLEEMKLKLEIIESRGVSVPSMKNSRIVLEPMEYTELRPLSLSPAKQSKKKISNKFEQPMKDRMGSVIDSKTLKKAFEQASLSPNQKSPPRISNSKSRPSTRSSRIQDSRQSVSTNFTFPPHFRISREDFKYAFLNGRSRTFKSKPYYEVLWNFLQNRFELKFWPLKVIKNLVIEVSTFQRDLLTKKEKSEVQQLYPGECKVMDISRLSHPDSDFLFEVNIFEGKTQLGSFNLPFLLLQQFEFLRFEETKLITLKQKKYLNSKIGRIPGSSTPPILSFLIDSGFSALEKDIYIIAIRSTDGREGFLEVQFSYAEIEIQVKCDYPEKPLEVIIESLLFLFQNFQNLV